VEAREGPRRANRLTNPPAKRHRLGALRGVLSRQDPCRRSSLSACLAQIRATHWTGGRFTDAKGKVHRVWACEGHADGLEGVRRLPTGS
jgi:hypothetical protein